jgi:probable phosphoglycerate mutase
MPQTIYLVRHGETVWNREGRVQGHLDSPLTTRGLVQARRAGDTLRGLIDDPQEYTLLTSPLGRARQTAAIVAEIVGWGSGACRQDPELREMSWGEWEGLTTEEIALGGEDTGQVDLCAASRRELRDAGAARSPLAR